MPLDPKTYVIATINFKGGVGKTTLTWLLARIASQEDCVLVVDADAQMSLTTAAVKIVNFVLRPGNSPFITNDIHTSKFLGTN